MPSRDMADFRVRHYPKRERFCHRHAGLSVPLPLLIPLTNSKKYVYRITRNAKGRPFGHAIAIVSRYPALWSTLDQLPKVDGQSNDGSWSVRKNCRGNTTNSRITTARRFVAFKQKACREIVRQYFYDIYETPQALPCDLKGLRYKVNFHRSRTSLIRRMGWHSVAFAKLDPLMRQAAAR